MTGIALIDVAVGIIFAILTFSLIASAMQEAIAAALNWRGRMLRRGLFRLLEDTSKSKPLVGQVWIADTVDQADLTLKFLDQPSIKALQGSKSFLGKVLGPIGAFLHPLYRGIKSIFVTLPDEASDALAKMDRMPSSIPRDTFAKGLLDTLYAEIKDQIEARADDARLAAIAAIETGKEHAIATVADAEAAARAAHAAANGDNTPPPEDNPDTLADDVDRHIRATLRPTAAAVKAYSTTIAEATDELLGAVDQALEKLPIDPDLRVKMRAAVKAMAVSKALKQQFDQVNEVIDGAAEALSEQVEALEALINQTIAEIGAWFDRGMDRVTGWYVRRAKYMLFLIGFVMAMVVNFDLIGYSNQLLKDEQLRQRVVAQAEASVAAGNVAGLQVERQTGLILAALAVNADRSPDAPDTITAKEVMDNYASIPSATAEALGLTVERPAGSAPVVTKPTDEQAVDAAKQLDAVFQEMVGAFPHDADEDGKISQQEREAAVSAYIDNVKKTFGESVGVLKSQFGDQGVAMGRTCPAQDPLAEPEGALGSIAHWIDDTFWHETMAQCIKQTLNWQGALSWFLLALGCTLGGQFWFDLLKSVIGVRAAAAGINSDLKALVGGGGDRPKRKPDGDGAA